VPTPPVPEQYAIAAFLDHETAKIDALVAKKESLIALLDEKRTALITYATTRGLESEVGPNRPGAQWLDGIPESWDVVALRRVIWKFVDYRGHTPEKSITGVPLVTARNVRGGVLEFEDSREYIPDDLYETWMVRGMPETGDVVVTTEAPLGNVAQIMDPHVALAQRIILLKAISSRVTNDYLKWYFLGRPGQAELQSQSTGSTAEGIKASKFKAVRTCVPPLHVQSQVSVYLSRETAKIDALVAKVREGIERLKEYRTALISAAVTGKIDVRGEAGADQGDWTEIPAEDASRDILPSV